MSCWTALCAKPAATARCRKCKACRNRPLSEVQTKRNRYLSKTRYVVEQSFGTLHRKFRYARAAYFGLIKVSAQSHLKAMCLNLLKAANRLSAPVAA
ncbi:transposase [Neisseria meningitidis]|nr:transposase [Neisseria meningitidis]